MDCREHCCCDRRGLRRRRARRRRETRQRRRSSPRRTRAEERPATRDGRGDYTEQGPSSLVSAPWAPVPCSVGALAPGLDIRADGGYVLVCPSYVIEPEYRGAYAWSVDSASEFAPMPEWLLDAAAPTRRAPHPPEYFSDIADGVSEGARNVSLASLTGKLFRVGLKPSQVFEYLLYWNTLNQPPLPEERITLAVRNIWFRERDRRGGS